MLPIPLEGGGWHCGANLGGGCRELGNSALASPGLYPGWVTRSQTYWGHIQPWPPLWNAMQWPLPCLESFHQFHLLPPTTFIPPLPTTMISSGVQASRNNNQEGRLSKENFCFLQHTPILRQRSPRALLFGNGLEKNAFIILSSWDTNISLSSGGSRSFQRGKQSVAAHLGKFLLFLWVFQSSGFSERIGMQGWPVNTFRILFRIFTASTEPSPSQCSKDV